MAVFAQVVFWVEAIGLEDKGIKFGVEFVELAGGFVEVFIVEFGDAPLFAFHLGGAVVVEFLRGSADGGDEIGGGVWGKGKVSKQALQG